jgi:hypothetical protein
LQTQGKGRPEYVTDGEPAGAANQDEEDGGGIRDVVDKVDKRFKENLFEI